MKFSTLWLFALTICLPLLGTATVRAEHHTATRLGNPLTRFAPPMAAPADLRARFRDPKLHNDFIEVLRQWGWTGDLEDFFAAGLTNEIVAWEIPIGDTMPFMSTREDGKPICLRNVTWAGPAPIQAYAFTFQSKGRNYRCITPKPCSNFFVVDLGAAPLAALMMECDVPNQVIVGRTVKVCLTLHNTGNIPAPLTTVSLPIPAEATPAAITDGGVVVNHAIQWNLTDLSANVAKQVCAVFHTTQPAKLNFNSTASSATVPAVTSACATEVIGLAAILLEKADDPDPVAVGDSTTYTVKVTNQGTADDSNVQIIVTIAPELAPVSSAEGKIDGQTVTFPLIPKLTAKDSATYKIVVQGVHAGDGHTKFTLSSDVLKSPISAEESTTVY